MAQLSNICRKFFFNPAVLRNGQLCCVRLVSTTGKNNESGKTCEPEQSIYKKVPDFSKPRNDKNWISYGYFEDDEGYDKFRLHLSYFVFISVLLCGTTFICMYFPDRGGRGWARREAFIRLHEREQLGLDPIDANYVDPKKVILPPDEELCEEDIVI